MKCNMTSFVYPTSGPQTIHLDKVDAILVMTGIGKDPCAQSMDSFRTLGKVALVEWGIRDRSFMGQEGGV